MKVVVTIPAYNEQDTLGPLIDQIRQVLKKSKVKHTVLVLDDGSKDKTREMAKKHGAKVVSHPRNYGLADTFRSEMEHALKLGADVIVHTDADGQYVPGEIPLLLNEIKKGYDFVLGSRFRGKIEYMPLIKRMGNRAFSRVISRVARVPVSDAQSGFRAFTREVAKIPIISNHTYTQEQIIRVAKGKFKIKEVPITFRKRKDKSRLISNPFEYAIKAWINLLRIYRDYQPLRFFGMIGSLFFIPGIIIGFYLVYLHSTGGIVGRVPFIMLDVLLISIGLQIVLFGFLADMNKK